MMETKGHLRIEFEVEVAGHFQIWIARSTRGLLRLTVQEAACWTPRRFAATAGTSRFRFRSG